MSNTSPTTTGLNNLHVSGTLEVEGKTDVVNASSADNAFSVKNGNFGINFWANSGGVEVSTENDARIRFQSPIRFDAVQGGFTINKMPVVIRCETDQEDSNAKGTYIEWDQLFRTGVTYEYGIASSSYRNWLRGGSVGSAPTFTTGTTGQKRVVWFGQHYESASGTGESTHMHANWETAQGDLSTIVTRLQVGYGEDWTEVSVANADFAIAKNAKLFLAGDKNVYLSLNNTDGDVQFINDSLKLGDNTQDQVLEIAGQNGSATSGTLRFSENSGGSKNGVSLVYNSDTNVLNFVNDTNGSNVMILSRDGGLSLAGNRITSLGTPTSGTDAATKNYVDIISINQQSSNYTITDSDRIVEVTANSPTITLPTAVGRTGRKFIIKNSGSGTVTVDGDGSETIDGNLTESLTQYDSLTVVSNGANYIII